jgi:hypothetical protein
LRMSWLIVGIGPYLYLRKTVMSPSDAGIAHDKTLAHPAHEGAQRLKTRGPQPAGLVVMTLNVQSVFSASV